MEFSRQEYWSGVPLPSPVSVALVVKNPSANEGDVETQIWSLGQEDPPEEEMATTSVLLPGEPHRQRSLVGYSP